MSRSHSPQDNYHSSGDGKHQKGSYKRDDDKNNHTHGSEMNQTSESFFLQGNSDSKRYDEYSYRRQSSNSKYGQRSYDREEEDERDRSRSRSRYGFYTRYKDSSLSPRREKYDSEFRTRSSDRERDFSPSRRRNYRGQRSSSPEERASYPNSRSSGRKRVDYKDLDSDERTSSGRHRNRKQREPEPEFPSRYLYNAENGLWYDQETGTYSYYDENLGGYVPWEETLHGDASMRLVVIESEVLEPQKLVIVDSDGLSVGRDRGTDKRLRLPEMFTSKFHASIYLQALPMENLEFINSERFNDSLPYIFCIVDCGSQHGTFVNDTRLSESKVASQPFILFHLDIIKIGTTTLQVHQHFSGLVCDTCGTTDSNVVDLAPVQPTQAEPQPVTLKGSNKRETLEAARKQELRRLKRQYAGTSTEASIYKDRAAIRRQTQPDSPKATPIAEVYVAPNHGERLLQKHGWERGQGLGSQGQGIVEPIALQGSENRTGLGYGGQGAAPAQQETLQQATRRIYRQRFNDL